MKRKSQELRTVEVGQFFYVFEDGPTFMLQRELRTLALGVVVGYYCLDMTSGQVEVMLPGEPVYALTVICLECRRLAPSRCVNHPPKKKK